MRKLLICSMLLTLFFAVSAQNAQDSAWILANYTKKEVRIPMRDGIKLFTAAYIPKDASEKHPILLMRTPYSCRPYGEDQFAAGFWKAHFRYYARENYIIVLQDVRGRWMSEGEYVNIRPFNPNKKTSQDIDEASDTYDAIDWLVKNIPGNNGNVGVMGISYPGFYSTMAALSGHPALKAVSPQAPVTDWFLGDDFHHNGAFFLMDGFNFYAGGFGYPRPQPTSEAPASTFPLTRNDNYASYLKVGALKNFMKLTGDTLAFWKDLYAHPDMDDWWKARNVRNFVENVPAGTATLVVGGLFDAEDCYGAWRTYEAIEKKAKNNNRIIMGPWFHGQWSNNQEGANLGNIRFGSNTSHFYQNQVELPFFNYYLKGKGDFSKWPEATIFFTGANEWKQLDQWPPADKTDKALYFQPDGKLGWEKPTGKNSFTEYISDPAKPVPYTDGVHFGRTREYMTDDQRFASRRPDVLTFQTDTLTSELTLGGTLVADLLTSISTTDADFVVKLIDVFPDNFTYEGSTPLPANSREPVPQVPMGGYQMLVRGEIMRGRYRKSFSAPEAFKPNKVEKVRFELPDIAHTFKKGHRIMIQVQSSWFPLADRNPQQFVNIYECEDSDFRKATIRLFHDGANSSSVVLPVIK
ncbi:MAG: CocE/NonD family hydrolase [Candidatus Pseudobacter hemicellulosilyticus]|uniref:CocE/NonD family hydrolase n=1 Tax=Candidatus Pseudobacter hemicellulosilyticus TaxID=3121375 RepID=A0AAJ5WQ90_9BACT|nr:MAG: CocE/NonD family hydrolase [Pseudobacter sp.]